MCAYYILLIILGFGKTVYINKCNFDPCVDMSMWPQKILLITPPEGEVSEQNG